MPLCIMLKTSAYVKSYNGQTKLMYFLIEDDDLLKKYNTIWDKVSADIKKNLIASKMYLLPQNVFLREQFQKCIF